MSISSTALEQLPASEPSSDTGSAASPGKRSLTQSIGPSVDSLANRIATVLQAVAYIAAVHAAADQHSGALLKAIRVSNDAGGLLKVHDQFDGSSSAAYQAQLYQRGLDFIAQIASAMGDNAKDTIVEVNAYGRDRLANVHHNADQGHYTFRSWVSPTMEPMARQAKNGTVTKVTVQQIAGHLPDPVDEGNVLGQDLIRTVDGWGRLRLVVVKARTTTLSSHTGELEFVRWIADDPQSQAIAQAQASSQAGGAAMIEASRIKGLQAPPKPGDTGGSVTHD